MARDVRLLVGTRKGAWVYTSDERRQQWDVSEPLLPSWTVHHMAAGVRGTTPRLYAAANHWAWGPSVARSDDGGATWEQRSPGLAFPEDMGIAVGNVWHVRPGHESQPGVVWAGTQPAGLFRSTDWGETWQPVDGLNRHAYRPHWSGSGGGDSCLHSIEIDPRDARRMHVSISTGGTYLTEDGGETWSIRSHRAAPTNAGAREVLAEIAQMEMDSRPSDMDPAAADEMHKIPDRP